MRKQILHCTVYIIGCESTVDSKKQKNMLHNSRNIYKNKTKYCIYKLQKTI